MKTIFPSQETNVCKHYCRFFACVIADCALYELELRISDMKTLTRQEAYSYSSNFLPIIWWPGEICSCLALYGFMMNSINKFIIYLFPYIVLGCAEVWSILRILICEALPSYKISYAFKNNNTNTYHTPLGGKRRWITKLNIQAHQNTLPLEDAKWLHHYHCFSLKITPLYKPAWQLYINFSRKEKGKMKKNHHSFFISSNNFVSLLIQFEVAELPFLQFQLSKNGIKLWKSGREQQLKKIKSYLLHKERWLYIDDTKRNLLVMILKSSQKMHQDDWLDIYIYKKNIISC